MKARLERRMHQLMCSKILGLRDAQGAIWMDLRAAFPRYIERGLMVLPINLPFAQ